MNSCGVTRNDQQKSKTVDYSGPPTIVYKTQSDFYYNVPVLLSDDKSKIVSYPAISDIRFNGEFSYPYKLKKGYLLDNRGIGKNVAFLKLTYDEYSKQKEVPKLTDLYEMIIDKDPLTEMYNCGNRHGFKNEIEELNKIIEKGELKSFLQIK